MFLLKFRLFSREPRSVAGDHPFIVVVAVIVRRTNRISLALNQVRATGGVPKPLPEFRQREHAVERIAGKIGQHVFKRESWLDWDSVDNAAGNEHPVSDLTVLRAPLEAAGYAIWRTSFLLYSGGVSPRSA